MIPLNNILFLDIETVSQYPTYDQVPEEWKELWTAKSAFLLRGKEDETVESVYNKAAIYAEFGKIVCISCGLVQGNSEGKKLILKSFYGDDEQLILVRFCEMLKRWATDSNKFLCAHNGKEFDFPYLCRRMIINNIIIPPILNTAGKKPWEVAHLDTMDLWKFGDFKNYTSLNLLAHTLGIPTPKDDIDGKMVGDVYWREKDIHRIVTYCQKDVVTATQVFLRLHNEAPILPDNIEIKN
ncbi:3'-5' exonuclease [Pseudoflavitalea sp. G-6-1-2]|uniref:ribonuclease H-like domain-containing protein n=1 Tax=Pseudoflavitalea sp. G-6-1-2 TaxID=2728841 RepID=UPI00146E42F5|nr:ribonuclease H-like domain-containing protein [Pseudoflavitalea sp. G-6-1-2]NML20022.1 3'-5' exonuclease [Pseudoflavitalea sp. G-6-1-2]